MLVIEGIIYLALFCFFLNVFTGGRKDDKDHFL